MKSVSFYLNSCFLVYFASRVYCCKMSTIQLMPFHHRAFCVEVLRKNNELVTVANNGVFETIPTFSCPCCSVFPLSRCYNKVSLTLLIQPTLDRVSWCRLKIVAVGMTSLIISLYHFNNENRRIRWTARTSRRLKLELWVSTQRLLFIFILTFKSEFGICANHYSVLDVRRAET